MTHTIFPKPSHSPTIASYPAKKFGLGAAPRTLTGKLSFKSVQTLSVAGPVGDFWSSSHARMFAAIATKFPNAEVLDPWFPDSAWCLRTWTGALSGAGAVVFFAAPDKSTDFRGYTESEATRARSVLVNLLGEPRHRRRGLRAEFSEPFYIEPGITRFAFIVIFEFVR